MFLVVASGFSARVGVGKEGIVRRAAGKGGRVAAETICGLRLQGLGPGA